MDDTELRNLFPNFIPDTKEWERWKIIRDTLLQQEIESDKRNTENEKILNREVAFEERQLRAEVEYWKDKNYRLGDR